ncbi:uncharacterized protein LOC116145430 [Pistacia vera]|uniref:uncharacterized protein LOC116145430 n=1 Tax=Pistacia vera TaxID=55513 RepID=UPI001263C4A1|nr:uncharacterized protein LOC116145430 [Pistacia vera]
MALTWHGQFARSCKRLCTNNITVFLGRIRKDKRTYIKAFVVSLKAGTLQEQLAEQSKTMPTSTLNHTLILSFLLLLLLSLLVPVIINTPKSQPSLSVVNHNPETAPSTTTTTTTTTEIFGVKIEKNPPQSKLDELDVSSWPKWECPPSKFPWTFKATETMYLLEGKVQVYVEGHEGSFEIGAGDLVIFPKGMNITWDVLEAVNKHYSLEE